MSFEQTVLIACIVVPAIVATVACVIAWSISWRRSRPVASALVLAGGWWIAIVAAMTIRQGWDAWPEDAWRQAIWPLLGWAMWSVSGVLSVAEVGGTRRKSEGRWIAAGLLAAATAMLAMPSGEAWSDTFAYHRGWMTAVFASCFVNAFSLDRMAGRGSSSDAARRWVLLVAIASLAGPLALAAATYASLSEWTMAITAATAVITLGGLFFRGISAWIVAPAATASAAGLIAAGRFYSYEDHPIWVFAVMFSMPTLLSMVDAAIGNRSTATRVTTAASIATILIAMVVYQTLLS